MSGIFTQVADSALQTPLITFRLVILFPIIIFFSQQSTLLLCKGPVHSFRGLLHRNGIKFSMLGWSFLRLLVRLFWAWSFALGGFLPPSLSQVYGIDGFVKLLTHVIFRRLQYALVLIYYTHIVQLHLDRLHVPGSNRRGPIFLFQRHFAIFVVFFQNWRNRPWYDTSRILRFRRSGQLGGIRYHLRRL